MKKHVVLIVLIIACLLSGCSTVTPTLESGYDDGHNEGDNDGYEAYQNRSAKELLEDEYNEFKSMIVNLMYDYKYDAVQAIQHYYPEVVEEALENEFGTKSIVDITEYLDNYRKEQEETVVGMCKFCKKTVYANDAVLYSSCGTLHETTDDCPKCTYAHSNCLFENDPPRIEAKP